MAKRPTNKGVKGWEEVFVGYSYALLDVMELYVNGLEKLKTEEDRTTMMEVLKTLGKQVDQLLGKLEDNVVVLGSHWNICHSDTYVYFADDFSKKSWEDINVGSLGSIVVSPENKRIWACERSDKQRLATGRKGEMTQFDWAPQHCSDVTLIPVEETQLSRQIPGGPPRPREDTSSVYIYNVLVTAHDKDVRGKGTLFVRVWREPKDGFISKKSLDSENKSWIFCIL